MENKYGKLTIIERTQAPEHLKDKKAIYYLCECDCGNKKVVRKVSLVQGRTTSCGCLHKEKMSEVGKKQITHGLSNTRFFRIWTHMRTRCEKPTNNQYHNYGAKGIKVCDRWQTFQNFADDMYESYQAFEAEHGEDTASIDRIDSNGNYEPSNCKWATQLEQARNRGDNISIVVNGKEYATLSEVAEEHGIGYQTIVQRYRAGKRDSELVKPVKSHAQKSASISPLAIRVEVNGVVYDSLSALQKDYPYISLVSISKRYKQGKRGEELIRRPKTKAIST